MIGESLEFDFFVEPSGEIAKAIASLTRCRARKRNRKIVYYVNKEFDALVGSFLSPSNAGIMARSRHAVKSKSDFSRKST